MNSLAIKAAVFEIPGDPLEIRTVELSSEPQPGEVLVRTLASGICHSDYHVVLGEWAAPTPMVLGHEGAGVVEAIGEGVTTVGEGDHVILSWTPSCGRCDYCVAGRPALCDVANETAYRHVLRDGTTRFLDGDQPVYSFAGVGSFAEYAIVQETAAIPVPRDAPLAECAIVGCGVTTGIGAVLNTAKVPEGASVLVIGCGGVGLSIVAGAVLASAGTIIAADLSATRLEAARQMGATHMLRPDEVELVEAVRELTSGRGAEYAFEAIGLAHTIETAYEATRRGGTAVVVGQVSDGVKVQIDPFSMSDQEKRLIGCNYGSCRPSIDFKRIVAMHMAGHLDLSAMISDRLTLESVNRGFDAMAKGEGLRAVIEY